MYARILVPVDGSAPSQCGLQEAIGLARDNKSTLVLLHVVKQLPVGLGYPGVGDYGEVFDLLDRAGHEIVERAARQVAAAGVPCESHVIDGGVGPVSDAVVAQALADKCELIVMGTHGRKGVERLAMGSDAELVVRHANVPVMLVKAPIAE